jgi:hypothetical protein
MSSQLEKATSHEPSGRDSSIASPHLHSGHSGTAGGAGQAEGRRASKRLAAAVRNGWVLAIVSAARQRGTVLAESPSSRQKSSGQGACPSTASCSKRPPATPPKPPAQESPCASTHIPHLKSMLPKWAFEARFWSIRFSIKSRATTLLAAPASGPVNLQQHGGGVV